MHVYIRDEDNVEIISNFKLDENIMKIKKLRESNIVTLDFRNILTTGIFTDDKEFETVQEFLSNPVIISANKLLDKYFETHELESGEQQLLNTVADSLQFAVICVNEYCSQDQLVIAKVTDDPISLVSDYDQDNWIELLIVDDIDVVTFRQKLIKYLRKGGYNE